ncbi:MAG: hypothetical protein J7M34_09975 [Anaerolineae bacterium]|nr:hypothetical protein [Anaerolineae bacterium]
MTQKKPIYADESVVALAVLHRRLFSFLSACKPLMASALSMQGDYFPPLGGPVQLLAPSPMLFLR